MIDFTAGCFGAHDAAIVGGGGARRRAVKNSVTCFYVTSLAAKKKEVLIMVTWQRNNGDDTSVVVVVDDEPSAATAFKHAGCNSQILWKKGSRSFFSGDSMFLLHWDFSTAKYGAGSSSEPMKDFYLIVVADAELVLLLGDKGKDYVGKFPAVAFSMYGRYERSVVPAAAAVHYSTKARFRDGGREHEVSVACRGDERDAKNGELCVSVDRKRAIHVPNLRWNFRGNQAISVDDGSAVVDVLWDVHDWWFRESSGGVGGATFLFRARSEPESERPCWRPEEAPATAAPPFTLSIQISKSQ